jgi:hypothetical protein
MCMARPSLYLIVFAAWTRVGGEGLRSGSVLARTLAEGAAERNRRGRYNQVASWLKRTWVWALGLSGFLRTTERETALSGSSRVQLERSGDLPGGVGELHLHRHAHARARQARRHSRTLAAIDPALHPHGPHY